MTVVPLPTGLVPEHHRPVSAQLGDNPRRFGDRIGTRIADMPAPTANALRRYGVTKSDWRAVGH